MSGADESSTREASGPVASSAHGRRGHGSSPGSVERNLLLSTAALFLGGVLLAVAAVVIALPVLETPLQAVVFISLIVVADLGILFLFLRSLLRSSVFGPLERIGEHAENVAAGAYDHSIPPEEGDELDRLVESLNTMAGRFASDQQILAANVQSLDRTNQDLVQATEELVRSARMASVGTLAAGLAHEVGNPLGALMGYLDVARSRGGGERGSTSGADSRSSSAPLALAVEEARRIDRIVRSILDFARPDPGLDGVPLIELPEALERAIDLLDGRGAIGGVRVERRVEDGDHRIRAGRQHLEQVILNLLMNALWAVEHRPSPTIWIRIRSEAASPPPIRRRRDGDPAGVDYSHRRRIPLLLTEGTARSAASSFPRGREVVLEVEDNGSGIHPDHLPHLFDPFFTTKEPGEGTGLGLALIARLVQELGGKVQASNGEAGGACFTLRLPAAGPGEGEGPVVEVPSHASIEEREGAGGGRDIMDAHTREGIS